MSKTHIEGNLLYLHKFHLIPYKKLYSGISKTKAAPEMHCNWRRETQYLRVVKKACFLLQTICTAQLFSSILVFQWFFWLQYLSSSRITVYIKLKASLYLSAARNNIFCTFRIELKSRSEWNWRIKINWWPVKLLWTRSWWSWSHLIKPAIKMCPIPAPYGTIIIKEDPHCFAGLLNLDPQIRLPWLI